MNSRKYCERLQLLQVTNGLFSNSNITVTVLEIKRLEIHFNNCMQYHDMKFASNIIAQTHNRFLESQTIIAFHTSSFSNQHMVIHHFSHNHNVIE